MTVYPFSGASYVNLTNRCPVACVFCPKSRGSLDFEGRDLRLEKEPSAAELVEALFASGHAREVVFCGYGEPTLRLGALLEVCWRLRRRDGPRFRLNTIGLGSLANGRDIAPELAAHLDVVSVSLNTADPAQWLEIVRPRAAYREQGFEAVCAFVAACVREGLETTVTAVELPGVDLEAVGRLAADMGARFRPRPLFATARA